MGRVLFFLFGFVFFLAGLFATYKIAGVMVVDYARTSSWEATPAKLESLSLKGSDSQKVVGKYRYLYEGREYVGERISISDVSDNFSGYWPALYERLQKDERAARVIALVNPNSPDEAILDRTFRWKTLLFSSIFLFMFCGFGGFMMWSQWRGSKSVKEEIQEANQGIASDDKMGFWFLFWFGFVFFLFGFVFLVTMFSEFIKEPTAAVIAPLIFLLIGGAISGFALKQQALFKRIGRAPLMLDPLPGAIGGQVGGYFILGSHLSAKTMMMTLRSKRQVKKDEGYENRTVWKAVFPAYIERVTNGTRVSFVFDVPETCAETKQDDSFTWDLEAEGELDHNGSDIKLSRSWTIPVLHSHVKNSTVRIPESHIQQAKADTEKKAQDAAEEHLELKATARGFDYVSKPYQKPSWLLFGVLFPAIFGGIGLFAREEWWPGYIFIVIGVGVGLLGFYMFGRHLEVHIDIALRKLSMQRFVFGVKTKDVEAMIFEPSQFKFKKSYSSSSGDSQDMDDYYRVFFQGEKQKITVAEDIKTKEVAEALRDKLVKAVFPGRHDENRG